MAGFEPVSPTFRYHDEQLFQSQQNGPSMGFPSNLRKRSPATHSAAVGGTVLHSLWPDPVTLKRWWQRAPRPLTIFYDYYVAEAWAMIGRPQREAETRVPPQQVESLRENPNELRRAEDPDPRCMSQAMKSWQHHTTSRQPITNRGSTRRPSVCVGAKPLYARAHDTTEANGRVPTGSDRSAVSFGSNGGTHWPPEPRKLPSVAYLHVHPTAYIDGATPATLRSFPPRESPSCHGTLPSLTILSSSASASRTTSSTRNHRSRSPQQKTK